MGNRAEDNDLENLQITIITNDEPRQVPVGSTAGSLLASLDIPPARVVVQIDGEIIWRQDLDKAVLQEGSRLEIVTLVGGG